MLLPKQTWEVAKINALFSFKKVSPKKNVQA